MQKRCSKHSTDYSTNPILLPKLDQPQSTISNYQRIQLNKIKLRSVHIVNQYQCLALPKRQPQKLKTITSTKSLRHYYNYRHRYSQSDIENLIFRVDDLLDFKSQVSPRKQRTTSSILTSKLFKDKSIEYKEETKEKKRVSFRETVFIQVEKNKQIQQRLSQLIN